MILYSKDLERMMQTLAVPMKSLDPNPELNLPLNYWLLLEEREEDIQNLPGIQIDDILYSKYYWCTNYIKKRKQLIGPDGGLDQQQFKLLEEISERLDDKTDWNLLETIYNG